MNRASILASIVGILWSLSCLAVEKQYSKCQKLVDHCAQFLMIPLYEGSDSIKPYKSDEKSLKKAYRLMAMEHDYFVKVISKRDGGVFHVDKYADFSSFAKKNFIEQKLEDLSVHFSYPVHNSLCHTTEKKRGDDLYNEVLIFPFHDAISLLDIPRKYEIEKAIDIGKQAFYKYGQAFALISSTPAFISKNNVRFYLNLMDINLANVMFGNKDSQLFFINFVSPSGNVIVDTSSLEILHDVLGGIRSNFKTLDENKFTRYKNEAILSFKRGYLSELKDIVSDSDYDELEHKLQHYIDIGV